MERNEWKGINGKKWMRRKGWMESDGIKGINEKGIDGKEWMERNEWKGINGKKWKRWKGWMERDGIKEINEKGWMGRDRWINRKN